MKKIVIMGLIALGSFSLLSFALPGNDFEGVITFTMSLGSGANANQAAMMMQRGNNSKIYIKGDKVRIQDNAVIIIMDRKTKEQVTLLNIMGNKYEIKPDSTKEKPDPQEKPEIKYVDSTKVIAGYKCKEAIATYTKTSKDGETNTYNETLFYTDELPYSVDMGQYKGLKGFALQYGIKQLNTNYVAQSVEKKSLSDTLFTVPTSGYKIFNSRKEMMEYMRSQMNSGGGGQ